MMRKGQYIFIIVLVLLVSNVFSYNIVNKYVLNEPIPIQENIINDSICKEIWEKQTTECYNNSYMVYYVDKNSCNTTIYLPINNYETKYCNPELNNFTIVLIIGTFLLLLFLTIIIISIFL